MSSSSSTTVLCAMKLSFPSPDSRSVSRFGIRMSGYELLIHVVGDLPTYADLDALPVGPLPNVAVRVAAQAGRAVGSASACATRLLDLGRLLEIQPEDVDHLYELLEIIITKVNGVLRTRDLEVPLGDI